MIYGSVCSGIEAATVAWHPLGWYPAFFSEIDTFPSALLSTRYPDTPNLGDMITFKSWPHADIDVLVGGTPCQSFSVAGLRQGLADPRGNLCLTYLAIAARYRPSWVLWENVPGVLSSAGGRDFGAFLGGLGQLGYGWAYRVLDAQFFGVPQRRRRVFVVGSARGWAAAAAVLFEREGMQGNPAPSRAARQDLTHELAPSIGASGRGFSRAGETRGQDPVVACPQVSPAIKARDYKGVSSDGDGDGAPLIAHALRTDGFDASEDGTGRGTPLVPVAAPLSAGNNANSNAAGRRREDDINLIAFNARQDPDSGMVTHPLDTDGSSIAVAFAQNSRDEVLEKDIADSLKSGGGKPGQSYPAIRAGAAVRRLTPRECERLQGFPDDYTLITYNRKPAKDAPRYKALGNSMAVPVMRWLGERIELVESVAREIAA